MLDEHFLGEVLVIPEHVRAPPEVELPGCRVVVIGKSPQTGSECAGHRDQVSPDIHLIGFDIEARLKHCVFDRYLDDGFFVASHGASSV